AGFDAVEVHGAHPYLLAQFASAAWNKRGDDYGGELKNRARFLIEIIKSIKQTVGSDFPVWPRINAIEYYLENGIDIEQGKRLAEMIQDAGADAVHVSCFGWGTLALANLPETTGALLPLAREIKSVVNIPVIAVGRITPELAEQALDEGWADFFAIGRASFADPNYVAKVSQGRSEDIASCIACNHCLHTLLSYDNQVGCAVNAALGREREYRVTHTANPKKVLVVGGGPAGLETARIASLRGHQVILCEKTSELGGQLILASVPPTKSDRIEPLARYLIRQVEKSDVEIRLNTEVTVPLVEEVRPDVVVLACGIASNLPDIPGIESPNVVSFSDVLSEKCVVGDKVAVIGAEMVGCETAEFLADKGKQVTLMRRGRRVATKIMPFSRPALLQRLRSKHVTFLTGVTYREINDIGVALIMKEGEHKTVEADTVVIAAGATSNNALFKVLEGKVPELHLIGDALEPRGILEAIREGAQVGRADAKLL
ncbi:MAG: FAD-dependent oxidoreductase, partial [Chloroflexota bacterium]|nr:FAD-dependent oxidoreductase [Chloroflexota bacterium]